MIERTPYLGCPLCNSEAAEHVGEFSVIAHPLWTPEFARTVDWLRCADCGHHFTSGYYERKALERLVRQTPPGQEPGTNPEQARLAAASIVYWVSQFQRRSLGYWLDVGVGAGGLLVTANEFGYDTFGLDIRPAAAKEFADYGAVQASFPDDCGLRAARLGSKGGLDVISMGDVLEHVPFPIGALRTAYAMLRSDGVLYLATPNIDSYAWTKLDESRSNPYWLELEHFHIFGLAGLVKVLEAIGFDVVAKRAALQYRLGIELLAIRHA